MKKYIGGFFEFELPANKQSFHLKALALTNGRACVNFFINKVKPTKIYIPSYTCDALFEPMLINKIEYIFYEVDINFEIKSLPTLSENEYIIYINYFGLKRNYTQKLHSFYQNKLFIDNTHDFFSKQYETSWSFTSARKYFGVPDGAYLYSPVRLTEKFARNTNITSEHLLNRLLCNQKLAFTQYTNYEKTLNSDIKSISQFSERLLSTVDYKEIEIKRKNNFEYLYKKLQKLNRLNLSLSSDFAPFCFPFLPEKKIEKKYFYEKNVFIPSLWKDSLSRNKKGNYNNLFSDEMLPLPIDHRYGEEELDYIIDITTKIRK